MLFPAPDGAEKIMTLLLMSEDLSIDGYNLTPNFNKETSFYNVTVAYNDKEISLNYTKQNCVLPYFSNKKSENLKEILIFLIIHKILPQLKFLLKYFTILLIYLIFWPF